MKADGGATHAGHSMSGMKTPDAGRGRAPLGREERLVGVVTRVAGGTLTITLDEGPTAVVLTDARTELERGEAKASLKSIKLGERAVIYAAPMDGKWLARVVKVSPPTPQASGDDAGTASRPHEHGVKMPGADRPQQVQEFTCPMHPEIRSPTQGKCPRCGMKLQPVEPVK